MNIKTENWNGYQIRFVEKQPNDWWAVAKDISNALGYQDSNKMTRYLDKDEVNSFNWKKKQTTDIGDSFFDYKYKSKVPIISETGIYEAIFNSERLEAKDFKKWVKLMLKQLRQASGLEGFEIFRMLDKEHQLKAMDKLKASLGHPVKVDFIKANTIANKAVSSMFGYPKMIKKEIMAPDMLIARQQILDDTVNLMSITKKFNLDLSVSQTVYNKYVQ